MRRPRCRRSHSRRRRGRPLHAEVLPPGLLPGFFAPPVALASGSSSSSSSSSASSSLPPPGMPPIIAIISDISISGLSAACSRIAPNISGSCAMAASMPMTPSSSPAAPPPPPPLRSPVRGADGPSSKSASKPCAIMRCSGFMDGIISRTLATAPSNTPSKADGGGGGSSPSGCALRPRPSPPPQCVHAKPDMPANQCFPQSMQCASR
mmetsp:Transcript_41358/g.127481  ORF Transcript_41358/g.127481 Transcript_41358/m.127481 type:complete len:208 (-) Transcript_41358:308-931(-)